VFTQTINGVTTHKCAHCDMRFVPIETLRDDFAAAALTGLLAADISFNNVIAAEAYGLADAMLEARER
jgi:hypothetical protein